MFMSTMLFTLKQCGGLVNRPPKIFDKNILKSQTSDKLCDFL